MNNMALLKYVDTAVTFAEVPDEISLCINLSGCPYRCKGCHSSYLWQDIGTNLDLQHLTDLIDSNTGITCVCLMGGDRDTVEIDSIASSIREYYPELKICWYSGNEELDKNISLWNFDYLKLGPYKEELGPLNSPGTNQRFYKVNGDKLIDITERFQNKKQYGKITI